MEKQKISLLHLLSATSVTILIFSWSCKKEDPPELANLTTSSVTEITSGSARSGGNIPGDGGSEVTARGVCWGTDPSPTISNNKTTDGRGTGSFTSSLTGLSRNTSYYVRAYATNSVGTSYGNEVQFTTRGEPATVTTAGITVITFNSAKGGGNVTDDGGSAVTAKGVVWGTSGNPTLENNDGLTTDGSGQGAFTSNLNELSPVTKYYVRAYATNSEGTAYGGQESFETPADHGDGNPCPGMPTIADSRDGTVYNTVQIGNQCWLKENLKYLPEVSPSSAGSQTDPHYYVYGYQGTSVSVAKATDNYQNYGVLYNWPAAMNGAGSSSANPSGVQGVCPAGWHLPSDAEWTELTDYVVSHGYPNESGNPNGAGNALKSCRQVDSPLGGECATSEHPRWDSHNTHYGTDQFGFSALPGSDRYLNGSFGIIGNIGYYGLWWSSTEYSSNQAVRRFMVSNNGYVTSYFSDKENGFSVRCIRND